MLSFFDASSFIESHYGQSTKMVLRQLEAVNKEIMKRGADAEFIMKCLTYELEPTFP